MSSEDPFKGDEVKFTIPITGLNKIEKVLRTPDDRFTSLPDFPYEPKYLMTHSHADVRIHYVDEGPRDAKDTIILMHGEPTWSYLYRHMIPPLVDAGYRVIAPDLPGFGRSDKPAKREDISYERLVNWMTEFVVSLGLDNMTLFAQDWGGLIGLRVVARLPERFLRVVISNTGMPIGGGKATRTFKVWASVISQ
jgi:haloalkane dehalogenase